MLLDKIEAWYERIGKKIVYILLVAVLTYVFFKYILELILPFVIAWLIAYFLNPFVTWMHKNIKLPRAMGTLLSMATILSGIGAVVVLVIRQLYLQIQSFAGSFGVYKQNVQIFIETIELKLQQLGERIPLPPSFSTLDDLVNELLSYIGSFMDEIVRGTYTVVSHVPNGLFFMIVVLISIFFMTKDFRKIKMFIKAQVPEKTSHQLVLIQNGLKNALGGYVKTQLILMCFTFSICLTGLVVLKRQYALLIALGIAVFDAFPIFGSGAVLIPWSIYHLIMGNYIVGLGLLAVYGSIVVVRQIMEPKVLSTQIGVYALVTLMSMYMGLKLMGVIGMILGPVVMVMLKTLQRIGVIPEFKYPTKEFDKE